MQVLVIDDEWPSIQPLLSWDGIVFEGIPTFSIEALLQKVQEDEPSVLLLDLMEADNEQSDLAPTGIRLFRELGTNDQWQALRGSVQVVFFSSDATAENEWLVARSMRADVAGFISKEKVLERHVDATSLLRYAAEKANRYKHLSLFSETDWVHKIRQDHGLLCSPNNHKMERIWDKILAAGLCYEPVLIQGETGTGKELVANAIFEVTSKLEKEAVAKESDQRKHGEVVGSRKLYSYNIASTPTDGNLQYTELFGAYREAAGGISKPRKGLFEKAENGTIFLDEIGDAAPLIQVSLLRVLQENKIWPLGGFNEDDGEIDVRFRLITASHVDLPRRIHSGDGSFRSDLYYRLNTIEIVLPPLRERKEDIPILVHKFLEELNSDDPKEGYGRNISIPDDNREQFFERLKNYRWPGNVRQLKTAIRSSYVMSFGTDLVLSEEVERMLDCDSSDLSLSPVEILDGLEQSPRPLSQIAKEASRQTAIEVAQLWVEKAGRHPTEDESQLYFRCSRETTRGWMKTNGVPSPRGRKKRR